jgi:hypothetical protein
VEILHQHPIARRIVKLVADAINICNSAFVAPEAALDQSGVRQAAHGLVPIFAL